MKSEKEILADFVFIIMSECGLSKHLPKDKSIWLKAPISGVRQAANDMIEMTSDLDSEMLKKLDNKLESLNLPTVTKMRQKNYKKTIQVLSRNKVDNEEEWHVIRSEVEIGTHEPKELKKMQELLDTYEFKDS